MGIIKDLLGQSEAERQLLADDADFFTKKVYFFELFPPRLIGGGEGFAFPLALNPQNYTLEEPFTLEATPTQGGGLYVEENGIVQRMIKLQGTTGFKPRPLESDLTLLLEAVNPDRKSYSRQLQSVVLDSISGQRHFQYLQDAVFRTYADLKRDPATSEETRLVFHNQKDNEHWLVAPQKFTLTRSKDAPVSYNYDIQLLVLGPAEERDFQFSEDRSWLDAVKDAIRFVKSGLDMITGAINDITALTAELTNLVKSFGQIIDSVTAIVDAAGNFVSGVTDFIQAPLAILDSTVDLITAAGELREALEQAKDDIQKLPDSVKNKFKQIEDGLERIMSHPEVFEPLAVTRMRTNKERESLKTSTSVETISTALATPAATSIDAVNNQGTSPTQGDAISADADLGVGGSTPDYTSTEEVTVEQGDTLTTLAAKFLGDGRKWQDIAVINGLKPPFVDELATLPINADKTDESPLPGAVGLGSKVLVPTFQKPPQAQAQLPILGVRLDEPAANHLLGTDVKLEADPNSRVGAQRFDIPIDTDRGAVDIQLVSGIDNIKQGVQTRLRTERGTNILYKKLGLRRIVGTNLTTSGLEVARFRVIEALTQDPRILNVKQVLLSNAAPSNANRGTDQLTIDATVGLRGFHAPVSIKALI